MPVYCYKCSHCGLTDEEIRKVDDRNAWTECDNCGKQMDRDLLAEQPKSHQDYAKPVYSEAMGVAPSQVNDHRKAHPDIPITNDGRVIVRSHREHRRIMKKLGMFDKNGFF